MSAGPLIRDSLQRELLDTQTDHGEKEEIIGVSEDEVLTRPTLSLASQGVTSLAV